MAETILITGVTVTSNLISNAFNFTKKAVVTITKEKRIADGSVIVSVKI